MARRYSLLEVRPVRKIAELPECCLDISLRRWRWLSLSLCSCPKLRRERRWSPLRSALAANILARLAATTRFIAGVRIITVSWMCQRVLTPRLAPETLTPARSTSKQAFDAGVRASSFARPVRKDASSRSAPAKTIPALCARMVACSASAGTDTARHLRPAGSGSMFRSVRTIPAASDTTARSVAGETTLGVSWSLRRDRSLPWPSAMITAARLRPTVGSFVGVMISCGKPRLRPASISYRFPPATTLDAD